MNVVPDSSHATSIKLPAYERYLRIFDGKGTAQIAVKICSKDAASVIGHLSPSARAFGFG
jgi:hypothetical protein